jgi:hypothetical protein
MGKSNLVYLLYLVYLKVHLGSVVSEKGGTEEDVASRIKKANGVSVQLYPVWRNDRCKVSIIICLSDLETDSKITRRLQMFVNKCLRRIMNIKWTDKITKEELWRIAQQKPIEKKKKEKIGIVLDTHYAKKQEQYIKPQFFGILRDVEEEVGRRERGEGQ